MVAKGGASLMRDDAVQTLVKELVSLVLVITPNIPEAEVLSGMSICTTDDINKAARIIHEQGVKNVIIKGGHGNGDALDILFDGQEFYEYSAPRFDTKDTHGTGCTFSAALATLLARGLNMPEAVKQAKEYITTAIRFSLRIGSGHGPTNHAASLMRESARYECVQELKQAVGRLKEAHCGNIIPEIQSNLGYALPYAAQPVDVAAIPGRIVRVAEGAEVLHDPELGASSHVVRIILTAMRYDENCRSAMACRFSEEIVRICVDSGYSVGSFSREDEPEDVMLQEGSSLEWGTNEAISSMGSVPDVIFDRGGLGKEPIVRVLGNTPDDIVTKVIHISTGIKALCA